MHRSIRRNIRSFISVDKPDHALYQQGGLAASRRRGYACRAV